MNESTRRKSFDSTVADYTFTGWFTLDPPAEQLKRIVLDNGGQYHVYATDERTHVIASNLPHSKLSRLKSTDKIVRPEWIMDSLAAGCLLPERDYRLLRTENIEKFCESVPGTSEKEFSAAATSSSKQYTRSIPATNDPNFLSEFYKKSRLHFLSSWGQEMKKFVQQIRQTSDRTFKGRERLKTFLSKIGNDQQLTEDDESVLSFPSHVMHLDMDCFFVSISLRNRPELENSPVAVCHSSGRGQDEKKSFAEVASCNYVARRYTLDIEPVSCDEMFVDLEELCRSMPCQPTEVANFFRHEIRNRIGCSASAGIGVGYHTLAKLQELGASTCGDLTKVDLPKLQKTFGTKRGKLLYEFVRGIDWRPVIADPGAKSVSCDVNYGIRFSTTDEAESFLQRLCEELHGRMQAIGKCGHSVTLKLMVRSLTAPVNTKKFLGHGECDTVSRSCTTMKPMSEAAAIYEQCLSLLHLLKPNPCDIRGVSLYTMHRASRIFQ
ncbi:unnamed protein product [Soboliphyme baturini]|uniref:DNA repair protein REV1 n=1 Tax=Soboliphyme baturini TaxID=241478 RepID=A0A183IV46_9BILA|nr:unnamed protein product [Soboliphyme baturini]